ncbi:hypothetical protein L0F63_000154 [Massospora cicadina]|nr:hypothetical protein L0F63_000154 [Massospora cicadina]
MMNQEFALDSDKLLDMVMYDNLVMNAVDLSMGFQPMPDPPVADHFITEFYEYDRESYRQPPRKRIKSEEPTEPTQGDESSPISSAELRRQIHIQSEQKRRAQIKDGFEELRKQLPNCNNKQISKAAILSKAVLHLQHLKSTQHVLVSEIDRLRLENDQLRNMQALVYPKLYSL